MQNLDPDHPSHSVVTGVLHQLKRDVLHQLIKSGINVISYTLWIHRYCIDWSFEMYQ